MRYTDPTGYYWADFLTSPSLVLAVAGVVACAGTAGGACAAFAAWSLFMAVEVQGASFGQAVLSTTVSAGMGYLTGGAVSGIGGGWSILAGAVAGGVSASMTQVALTGQFGGSLGETFLAGAATGALFAGIAYAQKGAPQVTQNSAAEQQGGRNENLEAKIASSGANIPDNPLYRDVRFPYGVGAGPEFSLRLTPEALAALEPVADDLGIDAASVKFRMGDTHGQGAFTVNDVVTLNKDTWSAKTGLQRLGLLAHEMTHSLQYSELGGGLIGASRFLWRYVPEYYGNPHNYDVPASLAILPMSQVDVLEPRYTLDQIANKAASGVEGP